MRQWPGEGVVTAAASHSPGSTAQIVNLPSTSQDAVQAAADPHPNTDAPTAKAVVTPNEHLDAVPPVKATATKDAGSADIRVVIPPLALEARASAHINLQTEPALAQDSPLELTIRQVPSGITFSRGVKRDADTWVFHPPLPISVSRK